MAFRRGRHRCLPNGTVPVSGKKFLGEQQGPHATPVPQFQLCFLFSNVPFTFLHSTHGSTNVIRSLGGHQNSASIQRLLLHCAPPHGCVLPLVVSLRLLLVAVSRKMDEAGVSVALNTRKALYVALWDYNAIEEDELALAKGDMVCASVDYVENSFGEWMVGENSRGKTGKFPATYVRAVSEDAAAPPPLAMNAKIDPDGANVAAFDGTHVVMTKADQSLRQYARHWLGLHCSLASISFDRCVARAHQVEIGVGLFVVCFSRPFEKSRTFAFLPTRQPHKTTCVEKCVKVPPGPSRVPLLRRTREAGS